MANTTDLNLGKLSVRDIVRFEASITRDDEVWSLSGATVTFRFKKPDRSTSFDRTAVELTDGTDGVFYYDTEDTDLDAAGWWTMTVIVDTGVVVRTYPYEIGFDVMEQP